MQNVFNLRSKADAFKQVLTTMPGILGNEAVNFFIDNFRRQGWLGNRLEPWRKRRATTKGKGRAILVQSGRLRRSIQIKRISGGVVTIGSDVPYAKAHNEGYRGTVSVKAHNRNKYKSSNVDYITRAGKARKKTVKSVVGNGMVKAYSRKMNLPRRQFMGNSPYLTKLLNRKLLAELIKSQNRI